jgi:hypothetical protein
MENIMRLLCKNILSSWKVHCVMKLSSFLDTIPVKQETYYKNHSKCSQIQLFIPVLMQQHTSVQQAITRLTNNTRLCTQLCGNWDLNTIFNVMLSMHNVNEQPMEWELNNL